MYDNIELKYSFIDSNNTEYRFGIRSRFGMSDRLVLRRITYISIQKELTSVDYGILRARITDDIVHDSNLWGSNCKGISEELRLHLQKFLKLSAFI